MNLNKVARQKSAKERQEVYDQLTTKQKIADLDRRLGKGVGAKKQRAKLAKRLEDEKK